MALTIAVMRTAVIIAILNCGCSSIFAASNEPIYLGIDAKGVRHESKESAEMRRGSAISNALACQLHCEEIDRDGLRASEFSG